jgi:carboxypeptidase Taq
MSECRRKSVVLPQMSAAWDRLLPKLHELSDLRSAAALLQWDQAALMPPKGGRARARTMATIEATHHSRLVDPEIGDLIEGVANDASDDTTRAHIRVLKRHYERATKVPPQLVRAIAEARGLAYQTWTLARPANDFAQFEPQLGTLISLKKQEADAVGWEEERYDALLDVYEPDAITRDIESLFADLVRGLTPVAESILQVAGDRPEWVHGDYKERTQEDFCDWLVAQIGFDFEGGRLDKSPHPFTMGIAPGDTRQTIRTDPRNLLTAIYAAIHETGHALYEQGIPASLAGLPAGTFASLGMHESQSRLWENQVGRSRPFTDWLLPHLKDRFESELGSVGPEAFHRGVNHPERGLIRVEADEVTYNLHVALRFELELDIFRDKLDVGDLPGAWDDAMERRVGIRPDSDANGVLQDVHWSIGAFGYFPTYTLGTLYAAAFYDVAQSELEGLDEEIRQGTTLRLLRWLRKRVHSRAFLDPANEIGERIIGKPLTAEPFLSYLRKKYSDIYGTHIDPSAS